MWLAFFFEAGEKLTKLQQIQDQLIYDVLKKFAIAALVLALVIGLIQTVNAKRRAKRMTK